MVALNLALFGWAPGDYTGKCRDCGARWWDGDKRAYSCRPCALALAQEAERRAEAPMICDAPWLTDA